MTVEKRISTNTTIGAFADATFLSYAPSVSYGSVPTDPSGGVLRLEGAAMWSGNFGFTLRHEMN